MSLQELNNSNGDLLSNRDCFHSDTIDLSNASTTVINSYLYYMYNVSNVRDNPNHTPEFWITMFCLSLFGLITNSSFVVTVVRTPSLHSTTYIFLTCLACSDCIILLTRLDVIAQTLFDYTAINAVNIVRDCLSTLCFLLATGFVILASTERYLAICHPLMHHKQKGTKRTAKIITMVFLISVVISGTYVPLHLTYAETQQCIIWPVGDIFQAYPNQMLIQQTPAWLTLHNKIVYVSLGVMFLLVLVSVSYMYGKILATLDKRKRSTNLQMSAEFKKHIKQASVMVIVNGVVYFLLTFVYIIYVLFVSFSIIDMISLRYLELAAFASYGVNASINPLLYFLTNERYRCAVKTMFKDCLTKAKNPQNAPLDSSNMPNAIEHRL